MPEQNETSSLQPAAYERPTVSPTERCAHESLSAAFAQADYVTLAAVLGLVLLVYAQLWLPGLVLIKRDAFQLFLPLKQYIIDRLSQGELPQWFPYEGLGRPLISLTVMGVFHPFTLLYWLLPVQDAYRLATLLCCLMATAGTFLLARSLGISRSGAAVGAIGFSCSGYIMSLTENLVYLYSICALPLFVYTLDRVVRTAGTTWLAWSALVWASVILNGDIQSAYYAGFVALIWTIMRTEGVWRAGMMRLAAVGGLTVLVAAIQLAPAWMGYQHSDRADASSFHAEAIHWSTHPLRFLTLLISPVGDSSRGDQIAQALFHSQEGSHGPSGYWAESLYLSPVLIGLAVAACGRRREMTVFTVLGSVSLVLAMGSYGGVYEVLYEWMPLWSAFRYPEKLMGLATFAVAMLAAAGVDVLHGNRRDAVVWSVAAVLLVAIAALSGTDTGSRIMSDAWAIPSDLARYITQSMSRSAWFAAGVTSAIAALLAWLKRRPLESSWAGAALVLLLTVDLARANLAVLQTSSSELWTFTPGLASALASDAKVTGPGHFRILSIKDGSANVSDAVEKGLTSRERIAALRRQGLYLEHNATFHIESIQHYLAGLNPRVDQIGRHGNLRVAARYNVAYFIGRPARFQSEAFAGSLIATVPAFDLTLARNPAPVTPRAYLSRKPEVLSPLTPIASLLEREQFLNGEVDAIESAGVVLPEGQTNGHATIVEYRPEQVQIQVETAQKAVLVLTDAFEPGWTARIEGGETLEIFRANGLVRAVVVPPGRSQVLFQYETPWLRFGACLSGLGVLIILLLFAVSRKQLNVSNRPFLYQS
ncbi:MAG TPA: YfhO family protein [Nitrospira sp.]|nr:YfhO family protein [Nitrospira sp.]